jgi:anthranilate 1,2-dioxygenase small subunit
MLTSERRLALESLLETYTRLIDDDLLEDWVDLFSEDARYEIISRENLSQGFALPLMLCENRDMIADRIMSLRKANIYNIHTDRHIVSQIRIVPEGERWRLGANFALYQTDQSGRSALFSVGRYDDLIGEVDGELRFISKRVIVDTGAVVSLLATPI